MNRLTKKSILITNPSIARDWDVEKNNDSNIEHVDALDKKSVWWTCPSGHSYAVSTFTRVRTNGCKYCNKEKNGKRNLLEVRLKSGKSKRFTDVASEEIISQWALDLNDLKPHEVTSHSKLKINWKCEKGHVWKGTPSSRIRGNGCPDCHDSNRVELLLKAKLKIAGKSLFDAYPDLKDEWDFDKNDKNPYELTPNSGYKVFWKCRFNHSWEANIYNRTGNGSGCPECGGGGTSKIEIYILCELRKIFSSVHWRKKIESFELDIFIPEHSIGIEVDGEYWHKDKHDQDRKKSNFLRSKGIDMIRIRSDHLTDIEDHVIIVKGKSNTDDFQNITNRVVEYLQSKVECKKLSEYYLNRKQLAAQEYQEMISRLPAPPVGESFLSVYPSVAVEWDYVKNSPLTPDLFMPKSDQKFWWICYANHSWQATIKNRTLRESNCPDCRDERRSVDTINRHRHRLGSIAEKFPGLISFWDQKNNISHNPKNVTAVLTNTYAWTCSHQHTFTRLLKTMIKDQSCKVCDVTISALGFKFPDLLQEWNYEKNREIDPLTLHAGTNTKVWWKCKEGHEWITGVVNRTGDSKSNCPTCSKKRGSEKTQRTRLETRGSLFDNYPTIASKWNHELNGQINPKMILSNTHTKYWWNCECGSVYMHSANYLVKLHLKKSSYLCENCKSK